VTRLAVGLSLLALGCADAPPPDRGTIVVALSNSPTNLDPGVGLDEASHPDPDGPGPASRFSLTLKTSTSEAYRLQATVIQEELREIGVGVEIRSHEFATLFADVVRGNVQMYTMQFVGITDPDMLRRVFHSSQVPPDGFNRVHYRNAEVDRLLDAASASLDEAERRQLYGEVQRLVAADAAYVSLWTKINFAVSQPDLTGVALSLRLPISVSCNAWHGRSRHVNPIKWRVHASSEVEVPA
jgi:peptide/nickel transport system substrate-binding protein